MDTSTFNARFAGLKRRFEQSMNERVAAIEAALASCAVEGSEGLPLLETYFHTLAGTAGTYALGAIAAVAAEGEEACADLGEIPPDKENFAYLAYLVEQLHVAVAIDAPTQGSQLAGGWS